MRKYLGILLLSMILVLTAGCGANTQTTSPATAAPVEATAAPVVATDAPTTDAPATQEPAAVPAELTLVSAEVGLNEDEQETIDLIREDLVVVTDETFPEIVSEILYHVGEYNGQVFQIEGVYRLDGERPNLYRVLDHDGELTEICLPLNYVLKDIPDAAWVRATGVVSSDERGSALDIVALEALPEAGEVTLPWAGHHHV